METVLALNGWVSSNPYRLTSPFTSSYWGPMVQKTPDGLQIIGGGAGFYSGLLILLLSLGGLALVLAAAGVWSIRRRRRD